MQEPYIPRDKRLVTIETTIGEPWKIINQFREGLHCLGFKVKEFEFIYHSPDIHGITGAEVLPKAYYRINKIVGSAYSDIVFATDRPVYMYTVGGMLTITPLKPNCLKHSQMFANFKED